MKAKGRRTAWPILLSPALIVALGLSALWVIEKPEQSASQAIPTSETAAGESTSSIYDADYSSTESDGVATSSADGSCSRPVTFPDLDLLEDEHLEYFEMENCQWELFLVGPEGDAFQIDLDRPCRPFPDDPDDPNYFFIELIPCEYTLVHITDRGELELVNPSEAAREAWDSGNVTSEETFAAPPPTSAGGPGSSQQGSGNSSPSATPEPSQEEVETPSPPEPAVSSPPVQGTSFCPLTREENPSTYDACYSGFAAPSIEWAGYHSCKMLDDPNFGTVLKLWGKVQLSGGSYRDYSWDRASDGPYGLVTSSVKGFPYVVIWHATAYFESMSSQYSGEIARVSGLGTNFIDESEIPETCRF